MCIDYNLWPVLKYLFIYLCALDSGEMADTTIGKVGMLFFFTFMNERDDIGVS